MAILIIGPACVASKRNQAKSPPFRTFRVIAHWGKMHFSDAAQMSRSKSTADPPEPKRLDSWKEIAAYLNRSVRCAQLWERDEGLPVHRIPHAKRGTVYALTSELDQWWNTRRAQLEPVSQSSADEKLSRRKIVIAAAAIFAATAAGCWAWWTYDTGPPAGRLHAVPLTSYRGVELSPSLSPDASMVAFSWDGEEGENSDIYIKVIETEPPVRLTTHPAFDTDPSWSPDGRFIAFFRSRDRPGHGKAEIILISALGGAERKVAEVATGGWSARPNWTRDSRYLIVPDRLSAINPPALFAVSVDSGEKRPITTPPPDVYRDASPALSADGKTLAFARGQTLTVSDVFLQRVSPDLTPLGDPRRITEKSDFYIELAWAGDGTHILASTWRNGIWRIPLSGSAPQAVAGTDGAMMFSFSGSKKIG